MAHIDEIIGKLSAIPILNEKKYLQSSKCAKNLAKSIG